ncbi:hypothetical protein ACA910_011824 [Epithemia clementina (nom. ined.)]
MSGNKSKMSGSIALSILDYSPPFYFHLHQEYIVGLAGKMERSFEGAMTEHLRMSGVYWSLTALSLLVSKEDVDRLMSVTQSAESSAKNESILDWLFTCFDERTGGFGGNSGQDGHMLYTLSAIQILTLVDALDDKRFHREKVINFVLQLQRPDGSWAGDSWGEIDTRFTYCALSALSQLQALDRANVDLAVDYILSCRNLDGGFGCVVGAESHAGQVFCCIGALAIACSLHRLGEDGVDLLGWWLAERQVDSGGLNGRPEKQADVCYSWWILSALSILGKVSWINGDKLASFILKSQDEEDGGISDRPDDMPDVFHTFFGIAGLSLLGHLHNNRANEFNFRQIDPVYALPTDVCRRWNLPGQIVVHGSEEVGDRLAHYARCDFYAR